ncbi:iron-containing redox enzyme family protein [bacterium]|nr:iron-containing redox enzyme family protein [bacterium]
MPIATQLDRIVEKWNLLKHPFYQAWNDGSLPLSALKLYACEYGAFISVLPGGWRPLGEEEYAKEEEEHIALWEDFAQALGTSIGQAKIPQVQALIDTAGRLFLEPTTAAGAMYAFEKQQPPTAQTKLHGLRTFYSLPAGLAEPYFIVHSMNQHEAESLAAYMQALSEDEQRQCLAACEEMGEALWRSLTGIHEASCGGSSASA